MALFRVRDALSSFTNITIALPVRFRQERLHNFRLHPIKTLL